MAGRQSLAHRGAGPHRHDLGRSRTLFFQAARAGHLKKAAVFLFYSESGLGSDAAGLLAEAGLLVLEPAKLAAFECP